MVKDKAMRNKVAKYLRDLRNVKTDYLTVLEKNRVIRSYAKGYIGTLRTLAKAKNRSIHFADIPRKRKYFDLAYRLANKPRA